MNHLTEFALRDQVAADVVIWITERLVNADGFKTFFNRLVVALLKTINPTEKSVRFGGRISCDGTLVERDRLFVVLNLLRLERAPE